MADPKTDIAEIEENTVSIDPVALRRDINDAIKAIAPEIDPTSAQNIPAINALQAGVVEYMNRAPDNQAAALEALEANVISTLRNGPTDDLMPRVEEMLNMVIAGIDDGKFVTAESQAKEKKKQAAQTSKRNAAAFASTLDSVAATNAAIAAASEAAAEAAGIPAATYRFVSEHVDNNLPQEGQNATSELAQSALTGEPVNDDDMQHAEIATKAIDNTAEETLQYQNMTAEQKESFLRIKLAENIANDIIVKRPDLAAPEHAAQVLTLAQNRVSEIEAQNPELFQNVILQNTASLFLASEALALSNEALNREVISLDYHDVENIFQGIYAGTHISEDGKTIIGFDKNSPQKYYTQYNGVFEEIDPVFAIASGQNDGANFIQQMDRAGISFDSLNDDIKARLSDEGVSTEAELHTALLNPETNPGVISAIMQDENFRNTLGPIALQMQIEEQMVAGQKFANDPTLIIDENDDLIAQQQSAIDELIEARTNLENSRDSYDSLDPWVYEYYDEKIVELDRQIGEMETQLATYKDALATIAEADAEIEQSKDRINELAERQAAMDPDGIGFDPLMMGHNSRMDIISPMPTTQDLIDMEYNEWQEAEAIKDGAEAIRDAIVEGTGAPEPEPDPAQQFVTENKSEIVAMLTEVPAHSREQLAELIQSMGDSHAVDITTAEANAILDTIENDPELAELSPVLGEPTADTTQVAHAAPEENHDYDIATPGMG